MVKVVYSRYYGIVVKIKNYGEYKMNILSIRNISKHIAEIFHLKH